MAFFLSFNHIESFQSYLGFQTIDAVCGGISQNDANGSAFSKYSPVLDCIAYLYASPCKISAKKPSQIPDSSQRGLSLCCELFQKLKLPMTEIDFAFGAHTAKYVPRTPFSSI